MLRPLELRSASAALHGFSHCRKNLSKGPGLRKLRVSQFWVVRVRRNHGLDFGFLVVSEWTVRVKLAVCHVRQRFPSMIQRRCC